MNIHWKFPAKDYVLLKVEKVSLLIVSLVIFFFVWAQLGNFVYSLLFTLIFVGIYLLISYFIQLFRLVEETYHFTPKHIEITRKTRFKMKKEKISLREVYHHKLDHFLLGGYL